MFQMQMLELVGVEMVNIFQQCLMMKKVQKKKKNIEKNVFMFV